MLLARFEIVAQALFHFRDGLGFSRKAETVTGGRSHRLSTSVLKPLHKILVLDHQREILRGELLIHRL